MAGPNYGLDKGYNLLNSGAAQSIYRFMKQGSTENSVLQVAAITERALGVCQQRVDAADSATSNVQVDVRIFGISKVEVGSANSGVIALGAVVAPDAVGCAQVAVATQFCAGLALQASTAAGQWIDVLLLPGMFSIAKA